MYEWLSNNPDFPIHLDCIEIDPDAIEHAAQLNRCFLDKIRFIQQNFLRYRPERQYNLIWAAGIFDYFSDKIFKRQLQKLLPAIAEGGELVIGNFAENNPSRYYMALVNWKLYHRNTGQLMSLAKHCDVSEDSIKIDCEPLGVNLFLHISNP